MAIVYGIRIGLFIAVIAILVIRFVFELLLAGSGFILFINYIHKLKERRVLQFFVLLISIIIIKCVINSIQFIFIPLVLLHKFSWQFLLMSLFTDIILSGYLIIRDFLRKEDIENRNITNAQKLVIKPNFLKDKNKEDFLYISMSVIGYFILALFYFFIEDLNSIFKISIFIIFMTLNISNIFNTFVSLSYVFRKDISTNTRKKIIEESIIGILRLSLITYFVYWTFDIDIFSTMFQIGNIRFIWFYLLIFIVVCLFFVMVLVYSLGEKRTVQYNVSYIEKNLNNYEKVREILILDTIETRKEKLIQELNEIQKSYSIIKNQLLEKSKTTLIDLIEQDLFYSFTIDENLETDESKHVMSFIKEITNLEKEIKLNESLKNNKKLKNEYRKNYFEKLFEKDEYKIYHNKIEDELNKPNINIRRILVQLLKGDFWELSNLEKVSGNTKLEMIDIKMSNITGYEMFLDLITELFGNQDILKLIGYQDILKKINSMHKPIYNRYNSLKMLLFELDQLIVSKHEHEDYSKTNKWLNERINELKLDITNTKQRKSIDVTNKIIQGIVWIISNGILLIIKQYMNI